MALKTLGKVLITTAGTIERATKSVTAPTAHLGCQSIMVQALKDNTGILYLGTSAMVASTGVGVIAIIPKPASNLTGPFPSVSFSITEAPEGLDLKDLYMDVSVSGEGAYISYTEQ